MKTGIELIAEERTRQVTEEGFTLEHDQQKHLNHELALAAISYACAAADSRVSPDVMHYDRLVRPGWDWPWKLEQWKPSASAVRNLVKAGALIAAEIDRLRLLEQKPDQQPEQVA